MFIGIIPARYGSSRFPGKPLAQLNGKPMIQHVWERTSQARSLDRVAIATDDERIASVARAFGADVLMTRPDHVSGTDRCYEAYNLLRPQLPPQSDAQHYVVNIQGDEPFIHPNQIDGLTVILDGAVEIATQCAKIDSATILHDTGEVKIALTKQGDALYFSRQPIPFLRGVDPAEWHTRYPYYQHVGLYAYRADILEQISQLPPSPLEQAESLEQLRWLEAGYKVKLVETPYVSICVDTPADLEKISRIQGGV
ncbi:3-deoxy-manno-octulosonate cytidylyltransferase [Spirosoma montaniterrae]|uniref:3-deoxy-manno-octulosonate cytidylyltransferase n=1 Tax=Spirosoma montaniterrae TaxID=1178516 RepID=A0A1P9X3F2_9BACT|nr:3-deoxy-manno-octulosonate cytidylyltransferase [Spirosoma montaniterrae]AQG82160.1 3-deoxy-manno-octulosonate cytidylyltransferase [Spirosoma montaniterrae]